MLRRICKHNTTQHNTCNRKVVSKWQGKAQIPLVILLCFLHNKSQGNITRVVKINEEEEEKKQVI